MRKIWEIRLKYNLEYTQLYKKTLEDVKFNTKISRLRRTNKEFKKDFYKKYNSISESNKNWLANDKKSLETNLDVINKANSVLDELKKIHPERFENYRVVFNKGTRGEIVGSNIVEHNSDI